MSSQRPMKRYGYEYSPANKAYEIAPIGLDGELDWNNELCVTAGDDDEAQAKLIVDALNHTADVEGVEAENEMLKAEQGNYGYKEKYEAACSAVEALKHALAAKEAVVRELQERIKQLEGKQ